MLDATDVSFQFAVYAGPTDCFARLQCSTGTDRCVCLTGVVPAESNSKPLASEAQELAPQLRGLTYVVVEELVTLVEPRTRKVESCFRDGCVLL
jgi:hypothetical protein